MEDKLTDEEFEELQKLFFIVIENIKDEYFELGMIAGKELNDLIEIFGDVKLLEIKEALQKMGYTCKIAGDKND